MEEKQLLKRCGALAKSECCNYHSKYCIQDECPCHLIHSAYSTIAEGAIDCDWFMDAVLPLDKELKKAVWQALTGQDGPSRSRGRLCEICRNTFIPASHRQKYCKHCSERERYRRSLEKQRRYDAKKRVENKGGILPFQDPQTRTNTGFQSTENEQVDTEFILAENELIKGKKCAEGSDCHD